MRALRKGIREIGADHSRRLIGTDAAAAEAEIGIEQQLARTFAMLDCQSGERLLLFVKFKHAPKIDGADYIHVVQDERLFGVRGVLEEEPGSLFQAAAGIEQLLLP